MFVDNYVEKDTLFGLEKAIYKVKLITEWRSEEEKDIDMLEKLLKEQIEAKEQVTLEGMI